MTHVRAHGSFSVPMPGATGSGRSYRGSLTKALTRTWSGRAPKTSNGTSLIESLDNLAELGVSYVSFSGGGSSGLVVQLGAANEELRHLDLARLAESKNKHPLDVLTCHTLARTLVRCPSLQRMSLAHNGLKDESLQVIVDGFAAGATPALQELDLGHNSLHDGNLLAQLLASTSSLATLSLEDNRLNDLAVMALSAGLSMCLRMRRLSLAGNGFGDAGAVTLANTLRQQRTCHAADATIPPPSLEADVEWLLDLAGKGGRGLFGQHFAPFVHHERPGLQQLDLARTRVSDEGAVALAQAVRVAPDCSAAALRFLNMTESRVGARGRAALEESVRANQRSTETLADWVLEVLVNPKGACMLPPRQLRAQPLQVLGLSLEFLEVDFTTRFATWATNRNLAEHAMNFTNAVAQARRDKQYRDEVPDSRRLMSQKNHTHLKGLKLVPAARLTNNDNDSESGVAGEERSTSRTEPEAEQQKEDGEVLRKDSWRHAAEKEVEMVKSIKIVKKEVERWEHRRDGKEEVMDEPEPAPEGTDEESKGGRSPFRNGEHALQPQQSPEPEVATGGKGRGCGKGGKGPAPPASKGAGKGAPPAGAPPPPKGGKAAAAKGKGKGPPMPAGAPFRKKLFWKQLDLPSAEGTIFAAPAPEPCSPEIVTARIDVDALQRMFHTSQSSTPRVEAGNKLLQKLQCKGEGVKVLSDNRARNVAIVMRRLSMPPEKLAMALRQLQWEEAELRSDQLEQLLEAIPSPEEAGQLRESVALSHKLRDVEQSVLPLVDVPRAAVRLKMMSCARASQAAFESTCAELATIRAACGAIRTSEMLREVLLLALELGNYINHGDSSKGARAISIGSLLQLRDFKLGRMSSLHFLCAQLCKADESRNAAEVLINELQAVAEATDIACQNLREAVKAYDNDIGMIQAECEHAANEYEDAPADADESQGNDVTNALEIRGSARQRLFRLQKVVRGLKEAMRADLDETSALARDLLRFCGVSLPEASDALLELEPFLKQLTEFTSVFGQHWKEVQSELPHYRLLFAQGLDPEAWAQQQTTTTTSTGSVAPTPRMRRLSLGGQQHKQMQTPRPLQMHTARSLQTQTPRPFQTPQPFTARN